MRVARSPVIWRDWSEAELARLRPYAAIARNPPGIAQWLAGQLERTTDAVRWRISLLRRQMKEQHGAEGSWSAPESRGAPSAAAPGSGHVDVSSLNSAAAVEAHVAPCAMSPAPGAAPPGAAPGAVFRGKETISRCEREKRRRQRMLDERRAEQPAPDDIVRKCSACRAPFLARSRFLFRCEPCRRSVSAEASGASRRLQAGRHG